jgi:putative peptidoglycan lipid II flippase
MSTNCLGRRFKWLNETVNGRIFGAASLLAGLTTTVKIVAFGKEILVARYFGASNALDAFYVAFLLPTFFVGIIANSCNDAFIPTDIAVRESEGVQAAQRLLSSGTCVHLLMLASLCFVLALSQTWLLPILGSGFDPNKAKLVRVLFFLLLSSLLLSGLTALWRSVLTAHESFALIGIAPICIPAAIAVSLLIRAPTWRIYALVFGSVLGVTAELAVNGYALYRLGFSLLPRWNGFDNHLRQILSQSVPAAAAAMLMGSTIVVDQSMAAMLSPGAVSALNYANRLPATLFGVGATSLSIAVFPALSRLSANRQWGSVRHVLSSYTRIILIFTLPVVFALIIFSEPLVAMVYQHGAFSKGTTEYVSGVQSILFLEVPFYGLCILYASAVCALKQNKILLYGTVISVVVNVSLNYVFMSFIGLRGIALSTVAVYAISFIYLRIMLTRTLNEEESASADAPDLIVTAECG